MAKERRKIIQAGRLWMAVQYTAIHTQNQTSRRAAKQLISTPAREALNARLSWQKLMLILAANFKSDDLVVTLTYRNGSLPIHREAADKRMDYFIRLHRAQRKPLQQELLYVRTTEGYHSDGRLHHHYIVNSTGQDFEAIKQLWARNGDNVEFSRFGPDGAERWAKYLTKEPTVQGRRHVGDRTWRCSRNLKRPESYYEIVSGDERLAPPPGAFVTDKTECENTYGRFCHIMAILPESTN